MYNKYCTKPLGKEAVMKPPTLIFQPFSHQTTTDIIRCFKQGNPLTPEQINFLYWHAPQLSSKAFDPVLFYYLTSRTGYNFATKSSQPSYNKMNREALTLLKKRIVAMQETTQINTEKYHGATFDPVFQQYTMVHHDYKKELSTTTSFLLPEEKINRKSITSLQKRLDVMLSQNPKHAVEIPVTQKKLLQFVKYTIQDLIFWRGNHFLTGDPFYPGGIPPLIHFQWGNYFGIVKYTVIAGEKAVMGNYLLYFEEMGERDLEQCILEYQKHKKEELRAANKNTFRPSNTEIITPHHSKPVTMSRMS